jgi:hypothetical protein
MTREARRHALTAAQRRRLPASAFAYPSARKYPMPTKAQARRAGIGERQRIALHRNALSRANQRKTSGSYGHVANVARSRTAGRVASVGRARGTTSRPGYKRGKARRR